MADTGSGSGEISFNTNKKRKKSPKKVTYNKDARSAQSAGEYPNYMCWKDRCGNSLSFDYSKGTETVTLQHRSGTAIQMRPDGGLQMTTHNGKYEVIFGEDRVTISGAQDVTVKGDASLRVYGDQNVTVHGNYNLAVMGDLNITAKNKNQLIRGNKDTIAKNETKKVEGSSSGTYGGGYARSSSASASVISRTGTAYFGAGEGVSVVKAGKTQDGNVLVRNKKGKTVHQNDDGAHQLKVTDSGQEVSQTIQSGSVSVKADKDFTSEVQGAQHHKVQKDYGVTAQGGAKISTQQSVQFQTQQNFQVQAQQKAQLRGESAASLDSSGQTHVGSDAGLVSIKGTGGGVAIDGQQVSLNSGLSQIFQQITGMQFELPGILDQLQLPSMSSPGAQSAQEEPDASSWTQGLA